jgi:hypothetical protein
LVQGKRSVIKIAAADGRPDTIHDHGLCVDEGCLVFKNLDSPEEQRPIRLAVKLYLVKPDLTRVSGG